MTEEREPQLEKTHIFQISTKSYPPPPVRSSTKMPTKGQLPVYQTQNSVEDEVQRVRGSNQI